MPLGISNPVASCGGTSSPWHEPHFSSGNNRVIVIPRVTRSSVVLFVSAVVQRSIDHVSTVLAAAMDERRFAGLTDESCSMTSALRTHGCAGRLLRWFITRAEDVFARIAAMVERRRGTEPSRSVTSALRADLCRLWRHERLRFQDLFRCWQHESRRVR